MTPPPDVDADLKALLKAAASLDRRGQWVDAQVVRGCADRIRWNLEHSS